MALIKLTAIVDNISGKLNGTVFANNKGGHYIRSKSNPTNPRTHHQAGIRAKFGAIASKWRELTQSERNAWDAAAENFPYTNRLGDTKILSGFALHQQLNNNLSLTTAAADLAGPPLPQGVGAVESAFGDYLTRNPEPLFEVHFDTIGKRAGTQVLMYATAAMSPGIQNFTNQLRLLTVIDTGLSGTTMIDATELYNLRFGAPAAGTKIGIGLRVVNTTTGEASAMYTYAAEVIQP